MRLDRRTGQGPDEGTLDLITINAAATTLAFDFYPTWEAPTLGPVHFDLQRAP